MKTVYIAREETVHKKNLAADIIIVRGHLDVAGTVRAKKIYGEGTLHADSVYADDVCLDEVEAICVICRRLLTGRVVATDVVASDRVIVSRHLTAHCVRTGTLASSVSNVDSLCAGAVVSLPHQYRGHLKALVSSWLSAFCLALTSFLSKCIPMDAEYEKLPEDQEPPDVVQKNVANTVQTILADQKAAVGASEEADFEMLRLMNTFKLLRKSGYTLRVIPGTPEENAPAFDTERETFLRPVA